MKAAHFQPPLPIRMGVLPCKDTVGFYGGEVLGNTTVKGCCVLELWWHGTLEMFECSQSNVRLSKYFGSPELIIFPCLRLWGVSLQKFTTSHMAFKQMLRVDSVCFYFKPFLEVLMLS